MSTPRRDNYRKPTAAEAAQFARINKAWLKMQRRKRTRLAIQWMATLVVIAALVALALALLWLVVMGIVVVFDGLAIILN